MKNGRFAIAICISMVIKRLDISYFLILRSILFLIYLLGA